MIEDNALNEVSRSQDAGISPLTVIAVALMSLAISQKRQADSMDRLEAKPAPTFADFMSDHAASAAG